MTQYFEHAGDHTLMVLEQVKKRLEQGDIAQVIIATSKGATIRKALDIIWGNKPEALTQIPIIAVTHQAGFRKPGEVELPKEDRAEFQQKGVIVVTATHALAGIDRAVRKKHNTWEISELIAECLRTFGQGTKVCAEITLMAADAGVISMEKTIAIGGTGHGADTAWVLQPAHTHTFFDLKMQELICKPLDF